MNQLVNDIISRHRRAAFLLRNLLFTIFHSNDLVSKNSITIVSPVIRPASWLKVSIIGKNNI
jgi:hypothetical protein